MHIGIDVSSIIYHRGVSRYTTNLAKALITDGLQLTLYGTSFRQKTQLEKAAYKIKGSSKSTSIVIQNTPPTLQQALWNWNLASIRQVMPNIDVFHSWDWLQPPDKDIPLVSTIHDLAILKFPDTAHKKILAAHQKSWQVLKERNAQIIAVSQATKRDIMEELSIPSYNIHVIPEALPLEIRAVSASLDAEKYESIKQGLNLLMPFILFVGTREPRKNLINLIKAWQPLANDVQLIIVGEAGWDDSENFVKHRNLRFLGKVRDAELSVLYSEAELLAYPSLYEGFGLPILEAFHYGTPVVTSNISSMIEVAGNAAELVNPQEVDSIRNGITTILGEDLTAQQKRLQRMIIRQQMFDWQHVARETKKVYSRAIALAQS